MKLENNFTGEESQKTVGELYCSEQLKEGRLSDLIFVSVLNIFLSITAFLGNILILVALHKGTSLNKPSKLLFRNLAVTDLCVGIIAQPLFAAYLMSVVTERWDICYYADFAHLISGIILCGVSLLTLTAISVERLLALLLGLRYKHIVTMRKAYVSCNCNVDSLRFHWRSKLLFSFPYIRLVYVYNYFSMCSHLKSVLCQNFLYITRKAISCSRRCFSKKTEPESSTEYSSIQKGSLHCTVGAGNIACLLSAVLYGYGLKA